MFQKGWNITFSGKIQLIQAKVQIFGPIGNPEVKIGRLQQSDVTTAPRAHIFYVAFSKFKLL